MENNITNLFKLINFVNKKTLINDLDDNVFIENGSFILQDSFKTCVYSFDFLEDIDNCFIKKEDLLKVVTKNGKYFVEDITSDSITIRVETKAGEQTHIVPLSKKNINLSSIIEKSLHCKNLIHTNGIDLKAMLKGQSSNITFKFGENDLLVSLDDNESFINFNEEFGTFCKMDILESDDSIAQLSGQAITDTITQFRLVKKNSDLNIKFNNNCFCFNNLNLTIYLLSNNL